MQIQIPVKFSMQPLAWLKLEKGLVPSVTGTEQLGLSHTALHTGRFLVRLNTVRLPCDPVVPHLGIYPREMRQVHTHYP